MASCLASRATSAARLPDFGSGCVFCGLSAGRLRLWEGRGNTERELAEACLIPTNSRSDPGVAAREQSIVLRDGLLDWLPHFVERCGQARPRFDVYPALASLLLGFVRADQLFLQDIAHS
jgi:hypothetical protein